MEDLKGVLEVTSDDEVDSPSPTTDAMSITSQAGFLFNSSPGGTDLHSLHPTADRIRRYWQFFVENCDPLMKMLHVPTMQQQIYAAAQHPGRASKAIEALLFAIYYATITSLSPQECLEIAGESQEILAKRYRYGIEQALMRAHFLVTDEIVVLQAFILFLVCVRRFEDPRVLWSLCGVACRIAITLGLHHDGTTLGITPFDIEIRRRTWWQILILDIRSSEDHGSDPVIIQHSFDTRFPLNVDDEDLNPNMTSLPSERAGLTKMSFTLTRYYTAMTFARLFARPSNFLSPTGSWPEPTFEEKQRWIRHCQHRLEERFFRHYNMEDPLHWITYTVARLILAKQWLMLYQPFLRSKLGAELPVATRDHLFLTSLEAIESSIRLEKQRLTVKWGWLFKTYTQFHALAFVLSELTRRTSGPMVDRAWQAVDDTKMYLWEKDSESRKGPLTKPIMRLEAAARAVRANALSGNQPAGSEDEDDAVKSEEGSDSREEDFSMMDALPGPGGAVYGFEHASQLRDAGYHSSTLHSGFTPPAMTPQNGYNNFYRGQGNITMSSSGQFPAMPPPQRQWSEVMPGSAAPSTSDWFIEQTFGALPDTLGGGRVAYPSNMQHHHAQQQQHHNLGQAHNTQHPQLQSQQHAGHQGLQTDSMAGGTEAAGMQFAEWDEVWEDMMMSGQGTTASQQWPRKPALGEAWM